MAASLNLHQIIGHLGKDPETRYTADGAAITNISVATSESWKDKNTGEKKEATEWHRVVFFGRLAEVAGEYLHKGSLVYISGKSTTRKWQDKDGNDRYTTELVAGELKMLSKAEGGERQAAKPRQDSGGIADMDDSIPF